jgi:hypothetical protein
VVNATHTIGVQRLAIEAASEALARELLPRLDDIQRRRIAPLIERLMDELAPPGCHVQLGRVAVDLGTLPPNDFEALLEERLRHALRASLEDAVRAARERPSPHARVRSEAECLLEILEHYLLRGTLPLGASRAHASSQTLVLALLEHDGLGALLRRHREHPAVLDRLVLQLDDPALARLLRALEPEHAALILAYRLDLCELHRLEPLVDLADDTYGRLLWTLVLNYVLRDPGSQFNRRSFVRGVLVGLASAERVAYLDLLESLRRGLVAVERHLPSRSSLPAVVGELVGELAASDRSEVAAGSDLASPAPGRELPCDLESPLAAVAWRELVGELAPADRSDGPAESDLAGPALGRNSLRDRESQLAAVAWRELVGELAPADRSDGPALGRDPPHDFEFAGELAPADRSDGPALGRDPPHDLEFAGELAPADRSDGPALGRDPPHDFEFAGELAPADRSDGPALGRDSPHDLESLPAALAAGPTRHSAPATLEEWLLHLLRSDPRRVNQLFRRRGAPPSRLRRLVRELRDAALCELLRALEPDNAALVLAYLAELRELHRAEPVLAMSDDVFRRHLWFLSLTYLVHDPGTQFNRKSFVRALVAGIAASEAVEPLDILEVLQIGLQAAGRRRPPSASLPAVVAELVLDLDRERADLLASRSADDVSGVASTRALWLALEHALRHGTALATTAPDVTPSCEALVLAALRRDRGQLRQLLRRHGSQPHVVERLVLELGESSRRRLLHGLAPDDATSILTYLDEVRDVHRLEPQSESSDEEFDRRLWVLSLQFAVRDPGTQFNRKTFLRALLVGLAAAERVEYHVLLDELRQGLAASQARRPTTSSLPAILAELLADLARALDDDLSDETGRSSATATRRLRRPRRGHPPDDELRRALADLGADDLALPVAGDDWPGLLARRLADADVRQRWSERLPEAALTRIVAALAPRNYRALLASADLLTASWHAALPGGAGAWTKPMLWSLLLALLADSRGAELSVEHLTLALLERFAAHAERVRVADPRALGQRLVELAQRNAASAGDAALCAVLGRRKPGILTRWARGTGTALAPRPAPAAAPARASASPFGRRSHAAPARAPASPFGRRSHAAPEPDPLYLDDAGLVLAGPFLPHLFHELDMLGHDERGAPCIRDRASASRAVHLVRSLVDGRTDTPEPLLVLPKILCGVPTDAPVARAIEATDVERDLVDKLLRSLLAHWPILSSGTSVAGLRETFLQRDGKLLRGEDRWTLHVQRKTLDVLVDQLPWSIAVVSPPWMPYPLYVTW